MRERAISAAVLVPVLLVVLALGGLVLAAGVAVLTVLAAIEAFRLLRGAGYTTFSALGTVLALVVVIVAALPDLLGGKALLLAAVGTILIAVAAFTIEEPREGLEAWMATLFGALYVSLLSFIIRLGQTAPAVPSDAPLNVLGAERGWILLLVFAVWSYDTGAYLVGKNFGRTKFLTHISPSKTIEGLVGGVVAATVVTASHAVGARRQPAPRAPARADHGARRAGRRPGGVRPETSGGCQGLRHADPGPRRDPRPGRIRSSSPHLSSLCMSSSSPAENAAGAADARSAADASRFLARPVRSDDRRSTSSKATETSSKSSRSRRARTRVS